MPVARGDVSAVVAALLPGEQIFLPGAAAEVAPLSHLLFKEGAPPLAITASFVPGVNPPPALPLPVGGTFANPFAFGPSGAQAAGQMRHLALSYYGFARHLASRVFDTCIVQVAPPDSGGMASLGPAVEFTPIAMARSRRLIAIINRNMPSIPGAPSVRLADAALVAETDAPLRVYDVGEATAEARAIAAGIAQFIDDGCTVQIGLGKVPDALLRALTDRRGLRLHSGMLSDGMQALAAAGALDPRHPATACVHVGTASHYSWLHGRKDLAVAPVTQTHAPGVLAALPRLMAVNGALEIDLFGQANLESIGMRAVSGVGGAADFAAAAARSADGLSIIGLPACGPRGGSRIVARLDGLVTLPRHDINLVVTEHGSADLRGLSTCERAECLIAIAAPAHRSTLTDQWREIAARL